MGLKELENDNCWQFKHMTGHQGPLNKDDPNYKCCNYNVTSEWEDRSITHDPLNILCAECCQKHDLLKEPGLKQFCCMAKLKKKL